MNQSLTAAVEAYFTDLRRIRSSGGATDERSTYGALTNLLNTVGATLKPKVFCVPELADQGAGHPDFGHYVSRQAQRGKLRDGQVPERGVVEVKALREDLQSGAVQDQVGRYWSRYNLVLVTNLLAFKLVGPDKTGGEATLESYRLADSEEAFDRRLAKPRVLPARSARPWANTFAAHCLTGPQSPTPRTWLGCSRRTHGTGWNASPR